MPTASKSRGVRSLGGEVGSKRRPRRATYPPRDRFGLRLSPRLYEAVVKRCGALIVPVSSWVCSHAEQALTDGIDASAVDRFDDGPSENRKSMSIRMVATLRHALMKRTRELNASLAVAGKSGGRPITMTKLLAYIAKVGLKKSIRPTKRTLEPPSS